MSWLWFLIPEGRPLSVTTWRRRHRGILILLGAHVPGLAVFGILGGAEPLRAVGGAGVVGVMALLAWLASRWRTFAAGMACLGLLTSSALLVHFSGGSVEMHFHFFVMVGLMALYQDWVPFVLAIGYVVVHHGLVGVLQPTSVFNHPAVFILAMSIVLLTAWRLSEAAHARGELILNSAGEGIVGVDQGGRITFANAAAAAMTGWSVDELVSRPLRALGLETAEAAWASAGPTNGETSAETTFRRKDGTTFPAEYVSAPIRERGRHVGSVMVFHEITRRKQAEAALRDSESRYRLLAENVSDVIWVRDMTLRLVYISPSIQRLRGYTPEEAMAQTLEETLTPASMAVALNALDYALKLEQEGRANPDVPVALDLESRRRDGSTVWTEATMSFMRDGDGRPIGIIGVSRDITERKRAEEALRESERRFRSVTESAPDAIIAADARGTIVSWNHGAEAIFGYTEAEILGHPLTVLMPERYRESHRRGLSRAGVTGKSVVGRTLEFNGLRKDGTEFPLELSLGSWEREQGRFYVGIIRDVAERKRADEALRLTEEQLRQAQKMDVVGRLAGGIAHDFNNLLTVIMGRSDLLLGREEGDSESRRDLEMISTTATQAAALTRQLLAFSRKQVLQPMILDLNLIVTDMATMLRRLIGEDIDLITALKRPLGLVRADRTQIEQVIVNLVVNARDAMPHGGTLTIETTEARLDGAFATRNPGASPGPHVVLTVRDTGGGMDAAVRAHLFEPFFTTKEPGKGTGLGLATVYGIVKQHEGCIVVESALGVGTTFRIYLRHVADAATILGKGASAPPYGNETILLVEDEAAVRDLAAEMLRRYGYTVVAPNPEEALAVAERHATPIHLLLTDIFMSHLNGRELADRLTGLRPLMKVLYMSGYTDDVIAQHGALDDHARLLAKPFGTMDLLRKVREVLDR